VLDTRLEKLIMHSINWRAEGKNKRKTNSARLLPFVVRTTVLVAGEESRGCRVDNFDYHFLIASIKLDELHSIAPLEKFKSISARENKAETQKLYLKVSKL